MKHQQFYTPEACGIDRLGFRFDEAALGGKPKAIAVTQDDRALYAVLDTNQVAVVDTGTLALITTLATGDEPRGIAMHPTDPRAYVANFGDGTVSVFATDTHTPVGAPIAVTDGTTNVKPASLAVATDGSRLIVNSDEWFTPGGAAWIDLGTLAVTVVIPPSAYASGIIGFAHERSPYAAAASDLDPLRFFAAHIGGPGIWTIDTATGTYASHDVRHVPCAVATYTDNLVVSWYKENGPAVEDSGIDIYRQSDLQPLLHIDVPSFSSHLQPGDFIPYEGWGRSLRPIAIRPDCNELWYANQDDGFVIGHVGIVSLDSGQFFTFAVEDCRGIAFTSDGNHAFLSDTKNERILRVRPM